jgi:hypothetical protein
MLISIHFLGFKYLVVVWWHPQCVLSRAQLSVITQLQVPFNYIVFMLPFACFPSITLLLVMTTTSTIKHRGGNNLMVWGYIG